MTNEVFLNTLKELHHSMSVKSESLARISHKMYADNCNKSLKKGKDGKSAQTVLDKSTLLGEVSEILHEAAHQIYIMRLCCEVVCEAEATETSEVRV